MTFFKKGVSCFIDFLFLYIAEEIKDLLLGFKACHNHLIPHSSGKGRRKTANHQNTVAIGVLNILRGREDDWKNWQEDYKEIRLEHIQSNTDRDLVRNAPPMLAMRTQMMGQDELRKKYR